MLRLMRPTLPAALLSIAIAAGLNAAAWADGSSATAISDLIPGPPSDSWTLSTDGNGPMTVDDFYGYPSASAPGFSDAYGKSWYQPEVGIYDEVARYDSVVWALYALSIFKVQAQQDPDATSVRNVSGYGYGAFEVTYPADTDGYKWDEIYFGVGDYLAALSLGATGTLAHDVLLDQSSRQLASLPAANAEVRTIRTGILVVVAAMGLLASAFIAGILLLILWPLRRPANAATGAAIPPGAQISPDGAYWWDGAAWRPLPSSSGWDRGP
jgi:hypothetical protein